LALRKHVNMIIIQAGMHVLIDNASQLASPATFMRIMASRASPRCRLAPIIDTWLVLSG
jgi:hypothetical protein